MMNAPASDPWKVFDYEADMFLSMCSLLRPGRQVYAVLDLCIQNALVESTLLHVRQLADILLSRGKAPDDINLSRLAPDFQSPRLDELRRIYGSSKEENTPCWTINKMLAHPTSRRGSSYNYASLLGRLAPVLGDIIEELNSVRGTTSTHPIAGPRNRYDARRWPMKVFDQLNLVQKIVGLLVLAGVVVTVLFPPMRLTLRGGEVIYMIDSTRLPLLILAEVLGGALVVGIIGLVRTECTKRRDGSEAAR